MDEVKYHNLVYRSLNGELSKDELSELEKWITSSNDNKKVYDEIKKVGGAINLFEPKNIPHADTVWEKIEQRIDIPASSVYSLYFSKWWAAAASIIIIAGALYLFNPFTNAAAQETYKAEYAQQLSIELSEGTNVKLNAGSELHFFDDPENKTRTAELKGEAFFDVKKNNRPFIIKTANAKISVVGTSFGIYSRNNKTEVIVKRGKVAFTSTLARTDSTVYLEADQMSVCINSAYPNNPTHIDSEYLLGWTNNKLVFNKTPLKEIVEELERRFDVKIVISNKSYNSKSLSGVFEQINIITILESVCLTLDLSYKIENNIYHIY